jgi:hypothetical protein
MDIKRICLTGFSVHVNKVNMSHRHVQITVGTERWEKFKKMCESIGSTASEQIDNFIGCAVDEEFNACFNKLHWQMCRYAVELENRGKVKKK